MVYGPFQTSLISACYYVHETTQLQNVASPPFCCVSASTLKAQTLRATTGTSSPQPGQISPRGGDRTTSSGASGQWWCRRGSARSSGKRPRAHSLLWLKLCTYDRVIPFGLGRMDSLLVLMLEHPKAQHRLPLAPAGTLRDGLLPGFCHTHPVSA